MGIKIITEGEEQKEVSPVEQISPDSEPIKDEVILPSDEEDIEGETDEENDDSKDFGDEEDEEEIEIRYKTPPKGVFLCAFN